LKWFGLTLLLVFLVSLAIGQIAGAAGQTLSQAAYFDPPQQVPPVTPQAPQPDGSIIHSVQQGDTLFSIALAYKVSVDDIKALNNLPASGKVVIGQRLLIKPAPSTTVAVM
jgi:LysM repeat protein